MSPQYGVKYGPTVAWSNSPPSKVKHIASMTGGVLVHRQVTEPAVL